MNVTLVGKDKVKLTSPTGMVKHKLSKREYIEVFTSPLHVYLYEDGNDIQYDEVDVQTDEAPQEVLEVFGQVLSMIMELAVAYNAVDDLKSMQNINIASLFQLAHDKNVPEDQMMRLIAQVVMLKTDIEAKFRRSWYDIWNIHLRKYLLESLATRRM